MEINVMKKIVLLPLDERPCNYDFPRRLFTHGSETKIVVPGRLGNKKAPADTEQIREFLIEETKDAQALILSVDMMLYGGLVPSRIHHIHDAGILKKLAETLHVIKGNNPKLVIYAFQVIMRCPSYSSSDEEPDYYETCGEQINQAGIMIHRGRLEINDEKDYREVLARIPEEALSDYVARRQINCEMNLHMLRYVEDGTIDFMVIPQDDSAVYGYAAMDQAQVRSEIIRKGLSEKVLMYPGADEVELTLMARLINRMNERKPKVYLKYISDGAGGIYPLYEGATLDATLKNHVFAAGCQLTACYENAELIIVVTAPSGEMMEAETQPSRLPGYAAERNLPEMADFIHDRILEGRQVTIADNAYANGADLEVIRLLNQQKLLLSVAGYAGWNTSANTIGTAIAEGVDALLFGITPEHQDFLVQRYLEDAGYCSVVRWKVAEQLKGTSFSYFDVGSSKGEIAEKAAAELKEFADTELSSVSDRMWIDHVSMPWKRMFEIRFDAGIREGQ